MKDIKKTEFPGKDKTTKRTYKTTYKMGYGKLKHVKMFENFDEAEKADNPFIDEDMYETIWAILNAFDNPPSALSMPEAQGKINDFFAKYKVDNAQDTEDVVRAVIKSGMTVQDATEFASKLGIEMNESKMNESSYTDFLTSYGKELKEAVAKMHEITKLYNDVIEKVGNSVEKTMERYDTNVGDWLDSWSGSSDISVDDIAKFAIDNMNNYGTEPRMLLDAIDDYYNIIKKG